MSVLESPWTLPLAGVLAGIAMGFVARRHHFCTMAALERYWYAGDSRGLRTWILAAAIAIALSQTFYFAGYADLRASFYLSPLLGLTGAVIGGLAFGVGMALVGTCSFGALVRTGGGSLNSAVVLIVLGLSALGAQRGLVAQLRVATVDNLAIDVSDAGDQSIGSLLTWATGLDLAIPTAIVITVALLAWVFSEPSFRRERGSIATGVVLGAAISFGWLATTYHLRHSLEVVQIEAGSFVVPLGDTILQFATNTGTMPDYGVGLVLGVIMGSALCAWRYKDVRWEACDSASELGRHVFGSFLMGTGGVFAAGCTIGQGVTGFSTLAVSAPVVFISIAIGAKLGLGYLIEGSVLAGFRSLPREMVK
ncbi:mmebrane protein [Hyphomicrobium methylovorum]|uniref:YeeE/YedE family protein n=1 Tax=Hyphomicrobium methylovorum TaxID=84 RepID=UPI0015E64CBC|nr:YeeE/YedE family protein [Hyphomicrobium methylovorum]MBA2127452.1 mmebrane protein [Hyphomicrobium methylovorum]